MLEQLKEWITLSPIAILDVIIVLLIFYRLYIVIRGTRAVQLIKGLAVLVVVNLISSWLDLNITGWLFDQALTMAIIAIPIIFYPELRRALEHIGRGRIFTKASFLEPRERLAAINVLVEAVVTLAQDRVGALIVWEQETGLKDWSETGVDMDAVLSSELLLSLFDPNSPLHDGAVILRANRVRAASCYLPLSDSPELKVELGTRHRAGLGITEQSDAVAIIVSEETGAISVAYNGQLIRYLDEKNLSKWLEDNLHRQQENAWFRRPQTNGKE